MARMPLQYHISSDCRTELLDASLGLDGFSYMTALMSAVKRHCCQYRVNVSAARVIVKETVSLSACDDHVLDLPGDPATYFKANALPARADFDS